MLRTRIRDLDADGTALEGLAIASESRLEVLQCLELGICKALGLVVAILDDANANNMAVTEKFGDSFGGRIVGQVAKMGGERRLVRELLGQVVTDRMVTFKVDSQLGDLTATQIGNKSYHDHHCRTKWSAGDGRWAAGPECLKELSVSVASR